MIPNKPFIQSYHEIILLIYLQIHIDIYIIENICGYESNGTSFAYISYAYYTN